MSPYHLSWKRFLAATSCLEENLSHTLSLLPQNDGSRNVGHDGLFVALTSVVHEQVNQDEASPNEI